MQNSPKFYDFETGMEIARLIAEENMSKEDAILAVTGVVEVKVVDEETGFAMMQAILDGAESVEEAAEIAAIEARAAQLADDALVDAPKVGDFY